MIHNECTIKLLNKAYDNLSRNNIAVNYMQFIIFSRISCQLVRFCRSTSEISTLESSLFFRRFEEIGLFYDSLDNMIIHSTSRRAEKSSKARAIFPNINFSLNPFFYQ